MLLEMARMSNEDGMAMQFHADIFRNHNQSLYHQFYPDICSDIPVQVEFTWNLWPLMKKYSNHKNFQSILVALDESIYTLGLAPFAGHYPAFKLRPPCWFIDSLNGITRNLEMVIESARLYKQLVSMMIRVVFVPFLPDMTFGADYLPIGWQV